MAFVCSWQGLLTTKHVNPVCKMVLFLCSLSLQLPPRVSGSLAGCDLTWLCSGLQTPDAPPHNMHLLFLYYSFIENIFYSHFLLLFFCILLEEKSGKKYRFFSLL